MAVTTTLLFISQHQRDVSKLFLRQAIMPNKDVILASWGTLAFQESFLRGCLLHSEFLGVSSSTDFEQGFGLWPPT